MAYMPYYKMEEQMIKYEVQFYEKENGEQPVEEFLAEQDVKMRAKIVGLLCVLEEKGLLLREPYSKHLNDGIFELRCQMGGKHARVLYFFLLWRKNHFDKRFCEEDTENTEKRNRDC